MRLKPDFGKYEDCCIFYFGMKLQRLRNNSRQVMVERVVGSQPHRLKRCVM